MKPTSKEKFQEFAQQISTNHPGLRETTLLYTMQSGDDITASMAVEGKFLTLHLLYELLGRPSYSNIGYYVTNLTANQTETLWDYFTPFHNELENHPNVALVASATKSHQPITVTLVAKDCQEDSHRTAYLEKRTSTLFEMFNSGALKGSDSNARQALLDAFSFLPNHYLTTSGLLTQELTSSALISGIDKFPSLIALQAARLKRDGNRIMHNAWVRNGVHIGKRNILMSNASVNIAAYIGDDNLVDAHASVGSAAQVGNKNKLGSFVSLEGVLSPANAQCVVIGDENFIGTYGRIGTGIQVGNKNFIGSGVNLSLGTKLRDCRADSTTRGDYISVKTLNGHFNNLTVVPNNATRNFNGIDTLPGEYLLFENSEEFMGRFDGDDRIKARKS